MNNRNELIYAYAFIWWYHDLLGESTNGFLLSYSEDVGHDKHASLTQYSFPKRNEWIN